MDSPRLRMLSGAEIVERGRNVTNTQLPEVGIKETTATGSWLEQKQVQAALEARKALVEVERIDKVGCLSHAEWLDEQRLVEVTQQIGGYWQYLGHQVNGTFYLLPEEALYLIETNCLLLKHNNVTVSLQKAYSLLLNDEMTLTQYKVYASLSRMGYKIFRHDRLKFTPKKANESNTSDAHIDLQQDNAMEVSSNDETISVSNMTPKAPENTGIKSLVAMATDAVMLIDYEKPVDVTSSTMPLEQPISNAVENNNTELKDLPIANNRDDVTELTTDKPSQSTNISNVDISDLNSASKAIENPATQSLMAGDPSISMEDKIITDNKGIKSLVAMTTDVVMNLVRLMGDEITETAKLSWPLEQSKSNAMDTSYSEAKYLPSRVTNQVPALPTDKPISLSKRIFSVDEDGVVRLEFEDTEIAMETHPTPATDDQTTNDNKMETRITVRTKGIFSVDEDGVVRLELEDTDIAMETDSTPATDDQTTNDNKMETDADINENPNLSNKTVRLNSYIVKRLKIQNRNVQSSDPKSIHDKFKDVPDFCKQQIVTVNVPCEDYLPRNVFLNNTSYNFVVHTTNSSDKPEGRRQTNRPGGNRAMYKTIRNSNKSENATVPAPELSQFVPNTPSYERPYGYYPNWRPHFQRPFYHQPRFNQHPYFYRVMNSIPQSIPYVPRPPFNLNDMQQQKVKQDHLDAINSLARSLNHASPNNYHNLKFSINGLIGRFNKIYHEKFIITPENHIVNTKQRMETIEIQDDEAGIGNKQQKVNKFDQYLANIKMLAARLKNLARKKQPIAKQKRAFSKLVKQFNKEYDAELYLDEDGELVDRKLVVLDSSDSDVAAVNEIATTNSKKRKSRDGNGTTNKKRKILANPFSVIAKLNGSTSQNANENPSVTSQGIESYFDKNWLPGDDDFGKAVPCSKTDAQHLLHDSPQLYEFMEDPSSFKTWVDLKLTFYTHMEAVFSFEQDLTESRNLTNASGLKPILQGALTEDWTSSEKLRIIKTNTDLEETSLCIHFDVYNRDVPNFRKTDPPTPHFRIVCVKESSPFPSTAEMRSLYSKYDDNVNITFAVVGIASISYLQIKPTDLPVVDGND